MARGTRDVELVVKARNEASKSLDAITSALDDLTKAQAATAKGSESTGSTLARLGSELQKLTTQLTASTGVDKLSASMDKASAAVTRMEASLTKAAEEAVKLDTSIELTQDSISRMAANAERLKNVLTTQKGATASAKEEFSKLAAELKAGEAALAGSAKKSQQYIDTLGKQEGKLSKLEQEHQKYRDAILYVVEPTAKLIANFEKTDAALRKQVDLIARTKAEYGEFSGRIKELSATVPALRSAVAASEASFNAAAAAQRNTEASLRGVDKESKSAAINLAKLKDAAAANAESLTRQSTSLDQAKIDLVELGKAAEQARLKTSQLDNAAFKKVADDAARLNKASEYVRWWEQALEAADKAEDRLAANSMGNINGKAAGYNSAAQAARNMGNASREAAMGVGEIEEKGRAAMSWSQRFRGELVALTLSFVGVYAAISQLRNVMKTVVEMDAAQTRLGVAFGDGQGVIAKEMKFVQAEADRLGISVKVLAAEYSKLAIATKDTSLAGDETRRIFVSLAEAFRVGSLTQNQMELAFNAISQMVSKSSVSMEELRQQLGERLAGAFNLAAQAAGYTTEEFAKLVAEGKIATETFLPKLADQLDKTFGPGLSAALSKVGADIGKFENNIVKAQMAFADGGFTKGLQEALKILNEQLSSREGTKFFSDLGAIVGAVVKTMAEFTKYGNEVLLILAAMAARIGVKAWEALALTIGRTVTNIRSASTAMQATAVTYDALGTPVQRLGVNIGVVDKALLSMNASLAAARAQAGGTTASLTVLQGAVNGAARSIGILRGVLAGLGGIPGLIITGLTIALTEWWVNSKKVVDTMGEHQRQMADLLDAYTKAKDKAGEWAKEVNSVSLAGAMKTLTELRTEVGKQLEPIAQEIAGRLGGTIQLDKGSLGDTGRLISKLTKALVAGQMSATEYAKSLDEILKSNDVDERIKKVITASSDLVAQAVKSERALAEQAVVVEKLGGSAESVNPKIRELVASFEQLVMEAGLSGEAVTNKLNDPAKKLEEQIDILKAKIPSMTDELKMIESIKEIDQILKTADAIKGLDKTSEAYKRLITLAEQAKLEIRVAFDEKQFKGMETMLAGVESSIEASAKLLRSFEGFTAKPKWDVNAFRAGFGSDTVTLSDGTIQKVTQGMRVSVEDANRDLIRRIGDFQGTVIKQIGADRFGSFSTEQQAVLTSIAYNYGSLPGRIIDAVKTGSAQQIATAIRGLSGDNGGVNAKRRNQEAYLFESGSAPDAMNKAIEKQVDLIDKRNEANLKYNEDLKAQLALKNTELEAEGKQNELVSKDQFIALQVQEEINKAKKAGRVLDEESVRLAAEVAGKLWEQKKARADAAAIQKEQQEGEKRISILEQQRRDIVEQMKLSQQGDSTFNYSELSMKLETVNTQLKQAIVDMITFWEKVGGPEAEMRIGSLKLLAAGLTEVRDRAKLTAQDIGNVFGQNLYAFGDAFLAKIRETGDVFESLRQTFRQFLSDFLLGMAQALMKVALFNAMMAASKALGGGGSFLGSLFQAAAGVKHEGGLVGTGPTRNVSPLLFSNAVRYHSGGIAGLKPGEVPTILQQGEEVLTASDPRHIANGGGAGGVKIINTIDSGSMVSEGLSTAEGEKAIFNFVRANKASLKQVLA